ncbi:hypothetical protein [Arthrobacter sp. NPDC057013]|uniref:hypothetical protein n=1 Tax=Arthrobacter sp. NPDC057013 TaxID=3345999 RepID=UPI00363A6E9B
MLLLLLLIPVLAVAGGQVCRQVYGGPGDTTLPGVVVNQGPGADLDLGPTAPSTTDAPLPLPPLPPLPSSGLAVNR